jgi:hypothetical protein
LYSFVKFCPQAVAQSAKDAIEKYTFFIIMIILD